MRRAAAAFLASFLIARPAAAEAHIAVAANFAGAASTLADDFAATGGARPILSFGATGALYLQIRNGAPYQAFLAADMRRPALLEEDGLAVEGSRFTYAVGELALFGRDAAPPIGPETLQAAAFSRLAIANPATAPYGAAAMATLEALGVAGALAPKIVRGKNVAQAFQFVWTGAAEYGLVARAQLVGRDEGARWNVPASLHPPIRQDALLIAPERPDAAGFLAYLRTPEARATIRRLGYGLAE